MDYSRTPLYKDTLEMRTCHLPYSGHLVAMDVRHGPRKDNKLPLK